MLTVWQLKVELESLHKLKKVSVCTLINDKISQSARQKLDSYCKKKQMVYNTPYLENEHSDPNLFGLFWQKLIFTLLHGKFFSVSSTL